MCSHSWRGSGLLVILWCVLGCLAGLGAGCSGDVPDSELGAHELGDRLLAPCCWREPLRAHPSELAEQLRSEIRRRLADGEAVGRIEADFVSRYGERIRALPEGSDPRWMILFASAALSTTGLLALFFMARPRLRRSRPSTPSPSPALADDTDYRLRLDEELAAID
jgi:cytochrome c-type biogenesis protein CcmH/NrfF